MKNEGKRIYKKWFISQLSKMKPFIPHSLPIRHLKRDKFLPLIGEANRALARFDWLIQSIPNASILLSPLTTKEATLSSKIEGTQATLQEVMEFEANLKEPTTEKERDIQEILNYRKAMQYAIKEIPNKLLTNKLIKEVHNILLDSVRGANKDRWNFRTGQVHIWSSRNIEEASYIPPEPQRIIEFMSNLEKYIHYTEKDILVQLAIVHAQFEIIHPFRDGNWRVGRIILPLFLWYKKALKDPMFYISEYLESHRESYYESLSKISKNNDRESWIAYFLTAVKEQSENNIERLKKILSLYETKKIKIREITHSQFSINTLDFIFSYPIFTTTNFIKFSRIPKQTATIILKKLVAGQVVKMIRKWSGKRPSLYIFTKLIDITG